MPFIGYCDYCGKDGVVVSKQRYSSKHLCPVCRTRIYRNDVSNQKKCSLCGVMCLPAGVFNNSSICRSCKETLKPCSVCGKIGIYRASRCKECFNNKDFLISCTKCGISKIDSRYSRTKECFLCRAKVRYRNSKDRHKCIYCGKNCVPARVIPYGVCCGNCRKKHLAPKEICPDCGRNSYLYKGKNSGHKCCPVCNARFSKEASRVKKG